MNLNNQEVILDILNIAIDAGKEILKIYKKNFNVDLKSDNSPITEADINSNNLIKKRLIEIEKNIPILTEESLVNWETRKVWKKYWLIDPLDGTKEFVNRNGEFTVNISLIENNLPIFGVIYAPVKSLLYYGIKNNGSYKLITQDNINTLSEFKKININNTTSNIKIIGSRSHSNKDFQIWVEKNFSQYEVISIGSSLKLCFLAEGTAPPVAPGPLAFNAIGWFGIIAVILAGWTTANPTIYRSGLAFQSILPKWSITQATLLAGSVATLAGIFPAFAMKLLDFVAVYGFILAPVGAVIVFEYYFAERYGIVKNYAEKHNEVFNKSVFFAWLVSFIFFFGWSKTQGVFLSFLTLPAWLCCGTLFIIFSKIYQKK